MNFARLLWDAAAATPDGEAIRESGAVTTYAGLAAHAAGVGEALVAAGVEPGDRVAVLLAHGAAAAAATYGAMAAGAVVTVLNWMYRPRQVEQALRDSGARVLITSEGWVRQQSRPLEAPAAVLMVESIAVAGGMSPAACAGDRAAQITYTSGSTGRPKGVVTSHDNLSAGVRTVVEYLGIRHEDRIASLLPFSFVYGFNQLNCAVATGASLDIVDTVLAPEAVRTLVARRSTVLAAVPPLWMQLLGVHEFQRPLEHLRILTCAGGRLSPEAVRTLRASQPQARLFLMYGLTEVFRSTYLPPEEVDAHPDSMGRAVPGSRVYVVREDGTLCDDGEVGELVHAGPTVALGYWNDPEATARVFGTNPVDPSPPAALARAVHSGDLVRRDAEGRLYYVGRRDRMIKTLGFRVSPDEITDVLVASGLVADAVVTSEKDVVRGERIVAHVVLRSGGELDALRRWCGTELPRHMQPARWDLRTELPRMPNGKHDVLALAGTPS